MSEEFLYWEADHRDARVPTYTEQQTLFGELPHADLRTFRLIRSSDQLTMLRLQLDVGSSFLHRRRNFLHFNGTAQTERTYWLVGYKAYPNSVPIVFVAHPREGLRVLRDFQEGDAQAYPPGEAQPFDWVPVRSSL